ncbi:MAG: DUF3820 family protein [Methylophilaceae bacterium]|nr:DUF3820 family protein [Methylophilaceae bacterium]
MNSVDLQNLVSIEMPYAKHKGRLLADLPSNYLNWFAREGFPTGELGRLLILMHEIDHDLLNFLISPLRKNNTFMPSTSQYLLLIILFQL